MDVSSSQPPDKLTYQLSMIAEFMAGRHPDPIGRVNRILWQFGATYLRCAREDFAVKSQGGTGRDGVFWPDLSPATKAARVGTHKKQGERPRGLLTESQDKRWRGIFASMKAKTDDATAAALAWHILKAEGAKTMKEEYASASLPILLHNGRLAGSLIPGNPENILKVGNGQVTVGSEVPYFGAHQKGVPSKNLPKRQIFPDKIPDEWAQEMLKDVLPLLEGMIVELVR